MSDDREATILEHVREIRRLTGAFEVCSQTKHPRRCRRDVKRALKAHRRALRMLTGADTRGDRIATLLGKVIGGALKGG